MGRIGLLMVISPENNKAEPPLTWQPGNLIETIGFPSPPCNELGFILDFK